MICDRHPSAQLYPKTLGGRASREESQGGSYCVNTPRDNVVLNGPGHRTLGAYCGIVEIAR
jgi:hypothetical protein